MIEQLPRQRVLNFLDAFYGGDTATALKHCDEEICSMVYLPVELFPHLGPRQGKAAIAELIAIHAARYSAPPPSSTSLLPSGPTGGCCRCRAASSSPCAAA